MKLHHVTLSIIFVSMIILAVGNYLKDLGDHHGATADYASINNTEQTLIAQERLMNKTARDIKAVQLDKPTDIIEWPFRLIQVGVDAFRILFGSWTTVFSIFSDIGNGLAKLGLPLPSWLVPSLLSMLLLTIIAIAVFAFLKWRLED